VPETSDVAAILRSVPNRLVKKPFDDSALREAIQSLLATN
jgi:hypothetical protein